MFSTLRKFIARLSVREYDILQNKDTFKRTKSKMALDFKNTLIRSIDESFELGILSLRHVYFCWAQMCLRPGESIISLLKRVSRISK